MTKLENLQNAVVAMGLEGDVITFGNTKLPKDTMIFNQSTALECPSQKYCKFTKICYAKRLERVYPNFHARNQRNNEWFKHTNIDALKKLFALYIEYAPKKRPIKYVRLNEAGDFISQKSVDMFSELSVWLEETYNIHLSAYTSRVDLDFSKRKFKLCASTERINSYDVLFLCTPKEVFDNLPNSVVKCCGSCKKCDLCYNRNFTGKILCREH